MGNDKPAIRAIVFDLDDTLYPERDYVLSGYRAVATAVRLAAGRDELFEEWLCERFLAGRHEGAFDAMNEHFHLGLSAEQIADLVKVYREHLPTIEPYGGIAHLLGLLGSRFAVGLLTDGFLPAQRLKLEALGLERFFDAVVFTESLGRDAWKPSRRGFEAVRDQLGVRDGECVYVGDNPAKDFVAPNAMGWRSIQWVRAGQVHAAKPAAPNGRPGCVVRDAQDLLRALR